MDLHAELLQLAPEQAERLVFMTGGAFTSRAREFLDQVRNPRIEKPFKLGPLLALLSQIMASKT
jgi:fluoride ion exporter CrcB/FEX